MRTGTENTRTSYILNYHGTAGCLSRCACPLRARARARARARVRGVTVTVRVRVRVTG